MTNAIKNLCQDFDILAKQADNYGLIAATGKQCWFLAKLCVEKGIAQTLEQTGWSLCNRAHALTKKKASMLIDQLLSGQEPTF